MARPTRSKSALAASLTLDQPTLRSGMHDASTPSTRTQVRSRGGSGGRIVWTAFKLAEFADREFFFSGVGLAEPSTRCTYSTSARGVGHWTRSQSPAGIVGTSPLRDVLSIAAVFIAHAPYSFEQSFLLVLIRGAPGDFLTGKPSAKPPSRCSSSRKPTRSGSSKGKRR